LLVHYFDVINKGQEKSNGEDRADIEQQLGGIKMLFNGKNQYNEQEPGKRVSQDLQHRFEIGDQGNNDYDVTDKIFVGKVIVVDQEGLLDRDDIDNGIIEVIDQPPPFRKKKRDAENRKDIA
jgi:hypothetical protein